MQESARKCTQKRGKYMRKRIQQGGARFCKRVFYIANAGV